MTDAGLAHLKELQGADVTLGLGGTKVTDAGLAHLKELKALTGLNLSRHEGDGRGAGALQGMQGTLTELNLGSTTGDGRGAGPLQGLQGADASSTCGTRR